MHTAHIGVLKFAEIGVFGGSFLDENFAKKEEVFVFIPGISSDGSRISKKGRVVALL